LAHDPGRCRRRAIADSQAKEKDLGDDLLVHTVASLFCRQKKKDLGDDLLVHTDASPFCRQKKKTSAMTYSSRPLPAQYHRR
jgi:hypothetical protein